MTTARRKRNNSNMRTASDSNTFVGYESELWRMADALRGSMDAAEYKHVVLGLVFLKYISDAFEEACAKLEAERDQGADPEDPDEYRAQSIFWVPPEARWQHLRNQARQPTIGRLVDDAMTAVERDNPALRDVLPKEYGRDALDKRRLGQVVDLVSNIQVGGTEAQATDVLGRVYEYFLEQFALAEGRKGGEFYTPPRSCGFWWKCWSLTRAAFTIPAAAPRACSSSRSSSSRPTLQATVTEAGPGATSPYTARSPTTPPGVWPG